MVSFNWALYTELRRGVALDGEDFSRRIGELASSTFLLAERVAAKVIGSVRGDDIVEALAARVETALSERICSRVADRFVES